MIKYLLIPLKEIFDFFFKTKSFLIRNNRLYTVIEKNELKELLEKHEINLILDVGANEGQFVYYIRNEIKYKGKIVSFEPNPVVYSTMESRFSDDLKWKGINIALGDRKGVFEFFVPEDTKLGSFLPFNPSSDSRRFGSKKEVKKHFLPVKTLDSVFFEDEFSIEKNNVFLKIDTQGSDPKVLIGAKKIIDRIKVIQAEIAVKRIYSNSLNFDEAFNFYSKHGFKLISLVPVTRERDTGEVIEYNSLWINGKFIKNG